MLTPAGKAELCAFAERVQAGFLTEVSRRQTLPLQGELNLRSMLTHTSAMMLPLCFSALATTSCQRSGDAETKGATFTDVERKVAFVLEHGLRARRCAAEAFVAANTGTMQQLTLADYQQRTEALRMHGWPLSDIWARAFCGGLTQRMLPRLVFVAEHTCVLLCCLRARLDLTVQAAGRYRCDTIARVSRHRLR